MGKPTVEPEPVTPAGPMMLLRTLPTSVLRERRVRVGEEVDGMWLYDWLMGDRFLIAQARYEDMRIATYDKVFFVKKCAG